MHSASRILGPGRRSRCHTVGRVHSRAPVGTLRAQKVVEGGTQALYLNQREEHALSGRMLLT